MLNILVSYEKTEDGCTEYWRCIFQDVKRLIVTPCTLKVEDIKGVTTTNYDKDTLTLLPYKGVLNDDIS